MKGKSQSLARVSAAQVRSFLRELANLSDDLSAGERFRSRFAQFLPWSAWKNARFTISGIVLSREPSEGPVTEIRYDELHPFRDALRSIWRAPDLRTKEWRIFRLREGDLTTTASFVLAAQPPPLSPFEQAILYLLKRAHQTRFCENPSCPAPYFLAGRSSQKYCSEDCALPAQREYKRRWWKQHGKWWRNRRTGHSRGKMK